MATRGPIQRQQLGDQVIQRMKDLIRSGALAPGSKLPSEFELMEQFGVGRSTIREAVRVLAHAGILTVRQGDGTYVRADVADTEPLAQRLRRARAVEVHEVRRALELEIVRLAAQRRDVADLERMRACLRERQQAADAGDATRWLDADIAFHLAVAAATKNSILAELYQAFAVTLREALAAIIDLTGFEDEVSALHDELVDALAQHDERRAYAVTAQLLDHNTELLRQYFTNH